MQLRWSANQCAYEKPMPPYMGLLCSVLYALHAILSLHHKKWNSRVKSVHRSIHIRYRSNLFSHSGRPWSSHRPVLSTSASIWLPPLPGTKMIGRRCWGGFVVRPTGRLLTLPNGSQLTTRNASNVPSIHVPNFILSWQTLEQDQCIMGVYG